MLTSFASKSSTSLPTNYSINLMWLNQTLNENAPYIDNSKSEEELINNILIRAKKWEDANPNAEVAIWYDSQFVTKAAVSATQQVLNDKISSKIKLKDFREIDVVKNNPDVFSDYVPVYFRVDIMKLIICVYSTINDSKEFVIFSDLLVGERAGRRRKEGLTERMTPEELFNAEIMQRLEQVGIQVNGTENQFIQIKNKPETIKGMMIYINTCLLRAVTLYNLTNEVERKYNIRAFAEGAFTHPLFFKLILGLINDAIMVNLRVFDEKAKDEWVKYDYEKHGCLPFGNILLGGKKFVEYILKNYDWDPDRDPDPILAKEVVRLPELPSEIQWGRDDVDIKRGLSHDAENLVMRKPSDGTDTYKCQFWDVSKVESKLKRGSGMRF